MAFSTIWPFVIAAAILLIIPGPAVFYIMARSMDQGRKAGLVSVLGVSSGGAIHVLAGAIGVSAILMTSVTAFNIVILAASIRKRILDSKGRSSVQNRIICYFYIGPGVYSAFANSPKT